MPVLALLSMTFPANADSPASAIRIVDVDLVQAAPVGARDDCWDDAPMDATVLCVRPEPEHRSLMVEITLENEATTDLVVAYESMDLTATGGTDYVALDGTVTVATGEDSATLDIGFIDDLVEEGNETFVVKVTPPDGVDLEQDYIHVTIIDEESIKVLIATESQTEGHPDGMLVDLSFTKSVPWPFTIRARTTAGTAGTSDYRDWPEVYSSVIRGTRDRPVISFRFRHPLIDDSLDEPNETYAITAWGYDNLGRESNSATMTIIDDDDPPSVSIADASGLEDSVGKLSFDVTLNTESAKEITLGYATSDDSATAGSDYTQTSGMLTFSAGKTTKTIDVPVLEDGSPEEDETFTVTLSNAVNTTIGDGTGTGTIQDDDPVPASFSIEDVVAVESREAMEFPVTVSGERGEMTTVTVDYATANRTAEAGQDYTETTGSLTFATDVTEQTIRVPLLDDVIDETHEIFEVHLSNAMGATFGDRRAEGKILDDDISSTQITLTASPARVSEDDGAMDIDVTAALDGAGRTSPIEVSVSVAGSGNADAVDFVEVQDFTITIAAFHNRGTATFTLTPINDEVDELDETLSVTGTSFLTVNGTEVELTDDDAMSSGIALGADPPRVSEGDGATPVRVTATLDAGARTEATSVTVTVSGSGDSDAVDFDDVREFTITIAAGDKSGTGTFTLTPIDDEVDESDETLSVDGTSVLTVTGTEVELADDDATSSGIALTADPPRVSERDGATPVRVTATLDAGARTEATTVTVSVAGSGDPRAVDFQAVADFSITIAANAANGEGTFTLTPLDDGTVEADETLTVSGMSDLPVTPATVTLADDDPAFSVTGGTGVEGDVVAFSVTLAGPSSRSATVSYATSDGTAVADDDYEAASGTLTFEPGEASRTVSVSLVDDGRDEPTETFAMTLSSAANATIRAATANGTIIDNDGAAQLSIRGGSGGEGDVLAFVVTLAGSSGQSVTVGYSTRDGTAVVGEDYEATEGVLTFAPGDLARTLSVTLLDDAVYEREENFRLELSSPANATLGTSTATGTIVDDDRAGKAPTKGRVLLFEPSANPDRQGFVRIINHSAEAGEILVEAVDDSGMRVGPVTLAIGAGAATHFNSDDLEAGNARKGLPDGVGPPSAGIWRLELSSLLDIEVLSYARTSDGFVTSLHDTAPATAGVHRVVFLNPGRNVGQVGRLRLINPGTEDAFVTIAGTDDGGGVSTEVVVDVPAGTAREWTAAELESGSGTDGALGDGEGKWRLRISSGSPVVAMSLIESPTGNLTNLSTLPRTPGLAEGTYMVPLLPSASDTSGRQGFVRVVNHSGEAAEVRIGAFDDTVWEYEPVTLAVGADEVASFNSDDLEHGNEAKGLTGSTGAGEGDWWLELSSDAEIEVLSYIRTTDGFLTSMHDLVPQENGEHRVVFFNPAKNFNQVSVLRLVNTGDADAVATITGVDDEGAMPGTAVRVAVPAGSSRKLTSAELESGEADAIDSGALGDGDGKWRLRVASDRPILVVSLLENPTGHLTNLSTAPGRGAKP